MVISLSEMQEDHVARQRPPHVNIQYRLIRDNDCHWYVIDAARTEEFNEWLNDPGYGDWTGYDFNDDIINSPYDITFEHFKIDGEWYRNELLCH